MYDVVQQPLKEIILIYIMFGGACLVTYPIINLIMNAVGRGTIQWR